MWHMRMVSFQAATSALLVLLGLLCECAHCQPIPVGPWMAGRSTFYGNAGRASGTNAAMDVGACGYGHIYRSIFPFAFIAAPVQSSKLDLFTGNCGSCYEVVCTGTDSWYYPGRAGPCSNASVVVQVTDSCPCIYPPNQASNTKWCCGDMPHLDLSVDAFMQLAAPEVGHIYIRYRQVSCGVMTPIRAIVDSNTNSWWVAVRIKNAASSGAVAQVWLLEPKSAGGSGYWQAMASNWGASWLLTHQASDHPKKAFVLPISLKVQLKLTGQQLVMSNCITSFSPPYPLNGATGWEIGSSVQFPPTPGSYESWPSAVPAGLEGDVSLFIFHEELDNGFTDSSFGANVAYGVKGNGVGHSLGIAVTLAANGGLAMSNHALVALPTNGQLSFFLRPNTCSISALKLIYLTAGSSPFLVIVGLLDGSGPNALVAPDIKPDSTSGFTHFLAPLDLSALGVGQRIWHRFLIQDAVGNGCSFDADEFEILAPPGRTSIPL